MPYYLVMVNQRLSRVDNFIVYLVMVETDPLQQYLIGVRSTCNVFVCSSGVAYILQYVKGFVNTLQLTMVF